MRHEVAMGTRSLRERIWVMFRCTVFAWLGAVAYAKLLRPRIVNWGATEEEASRAMPGDGVVPDAALQTTRAISIGAPPEAVWPWLVQMGPKPRAGVYTYDWIERRLGIDIENADRILPEFQHLDVGEYFALNQKTGLRVIEVEPGKALVLQWVPAGSTWCFGLYPDEQGGTRLVSRNRLPGSGAGFRVSMAVMEPASLVMERKMLLGIRDRAERGDSGAVAVGA